MARKPNVIVCWPNDWVRPIIFPPEQVERLNAISHCTWNPHERQYTPEELRDGLAGMEICVTGWGTPRLDENVLSKADALKLVVHTAGSVGSIASEALYDRNIPISSSNDVMARQVAECSIMLTLMGLRRARQFIDPMHAPAGQYKWLNYYKSGLRATPTCKAVIGIIGLGAIARWYIQFLKPMGPRILLFSRHSKPEEAARLGVELVDLETLLRTSDVVNVLCGMTQETYHLLNAERLAMMKDGAALINVGRGAIIDEQALVEELRRGRIYALLDVYEVEPLPESSPLRGLPNATLLPHIAGAGNEGDYSRFGIDEIERYLAGEPLQGLVSRGQWQNMTQAVLVDSISKHRGGQKRV